MERKTDRGERITARRRPLLQNLETRVLFSASPGTESFLDFVPTTDGSAAQTVDVPAAEYVFVDAAVQERDGVVEDLRSQLDRNLKIVLLDADRDGVEQIADVLSNARDVSAIHILSHGDQAELRLGDARLTLDSMRTDHAEALATVRNALGQDGDVLIYGCNFGEGNVGALAVRTLSELTQADVAASTNLTGDLRQGADWQLEFQAGDIEAEIALSASFQSQSTMVLDLVQEFFVPLTEQGIYDANEKILNEGLHGAVSTDTWTVIALTINDDNAVIVYDHHEDGYEADLENPSQATTEIWGDNDASNGIAPGFTTDVFVAGDSVILQNLIDTTAVPDVTFDFDGGDRFASDIGIAVIRAGWADVPGPVLAGTVEVAETGRWGTDYSVPIGEDTVLNNLFEYTGLFVQASEDGTVVDIDSDGDGTVDTTTTLSRGETIHIDGGVLQGATVSASAPVQVDLITGDRDSSVDSRWYMLRPTDAWSSEYLGPAATTDATAPGSILIHNPHATDIDIDIETIAGTTTLTVAPGATTVQTLGLEAPTSGQFVSSTDGRDFYAVFAMDTDAAAHTAYDWGFSLLPTTALTEMAFAGWAPGSRDLSGNGSPVWVTANSATTLYIDEDGDPTTGALTDPFGNQYDRQVNIARLESAQIYDLSGDNDQTGLRVYTVDGTGIAAAWGLDPATAAPGNPFLDMGTVVLPFPVPRIEKDVALTGDVDGNGFLDPGDTVTWTVQITNQDINPITGVLVLDSTPANTTYVANSTTLNGVAFPDDTVGATLMPADEGGASLPDVAANDTLTLEFQTVLDDFPPVYNTIVNDVIVSTDQAVRGASASMTVGTYPLELEKEIGAINNASSGVSGNVDVTYDFTVYNNDLIDVQNFTLTDDWSGQLGSNFVRVVPGSVSVTNIDAATLPTVNAAYSGGAGETMITGGRANSGQSFRVSVDVEIDPDADPSFHVLNNLVNQATVSGEDVAVPGVPISDLSDDPNNSTNQDVEGDNEADDPTAFTLGMIEVEKTAGTIVPASSGTDGNFDVLYRFAVTNTGIDDLTNLSLVDDWDGQFGNAFVRVVPGSVTLNNISATTLPNGRAAYAGGATENMFDGTSGLLESGQTFEVSVLVEVDPDNDPAALVNGLLVNQATVTANDSSGTVTDNSDDPTDPANTENDTSPDNDPDDPTTLGISAIAATKVYSGSVAASSGTPGNVDATYSFEVTNTGSLDLTNLTLVDDWASQFGDAFVRIVPGTVSVTNVDATSVPGANAAYAGGAGENMLNGGGLLETTQSYRVSVVVELDPNSPTGIYQADGSLENQATAGGTDPNSTMVTDATDDTTDSSNVDSNGDNNPDDPTNVIFAELVTVKTLASGDSTPDEGDTVTFQIQVTNDGRGQATNVSLTDLLPAGLTATANNGSVSQGIYNAGTGQWTIGTLNNGASATLTLEGTVDVGQGGNTIDNTTTAAVGDQEDPSTVGDDLTEQVVVANDASLVTVKTLASGDSTPDEGDTVTFQIQVTNSGAAQATNVSLTDQLPSGLTVTANNGTVSQGTYNAVTGVWSIGTLNNGVSATLTLEGTVNVGQGGNTITNNTTAAAGDQNDPDTIGDDLTEAVVVNNDASLVTVKTLASGDSTPDEGDTVTFQIQVTNSGAAQATNVSLTDQLPSGLTATINNGTTSQGSYNAATGVWNVGTLNNGATATLTLEGTVGVGEGGNTITNTTTAAAGDQNDPDTIGDDLTETVNVNNDASLVTVKTLASGDSTPDEGDTVTFQIQVTNNGAAQATNVSLTDQIPSGLTATANNGITSQGSYNAATGVWSVGTLNNGTSATLTLEGTVDVGEGGNTITNTTTAAAGDQNDPDTIGDDLTETVDVNDDASLVTVKTLASGDSTPDEGDTVTFQIQVTNSGAAQATNISLTDQLPSGLTATVNNGTTSQGSYNAATGIWSIGTLNNGASATLTLEGTVDVGQANSTITNTTTAAAGDQNDPDTIGDDLTESVSVGNDASLVTVKTLASGDSTPDEGDTVTFQIQVTNSGAAQATNVSLTDQLPSGLTVTVNNGTVSQGTYNAVTGVWSIGTLNNGANATLTLEGTVDVGQGGNTITNTTTAAAGDQNDPDTIGDDLDEQVVVNNDASLVTVKTLASVDSTPDEGDTVTFQIQVTNSGAAQATNVSLTDQLPSGLTATINNGTTSQGSYNAATGIWSVGTLSNGASATLTLEGTVDVGEGGNTITNTTTAAAGDQNDPDTIGDDLEEQVVVNNDASLVTVKTLASGDSTPDEGDTVTFQIQVTNSGAAQATNVSLTDQLPAGLTATANNGSVSQGSYNAATGIWSIGTLNNGASATLTLEGTVDVGQANGTITNTTTAAAGDQNDPDTIGDDLEEQVVVNNDASLVTVKTLASGDSTPDEGDTVTFQIQVTNSGAAQATNVSLTDQLPSGLTATINNGTTSQGSYNAATGVWSVGTLNNGASATLTLEGTVDVGEGGNTITNTTTPAAGDQNDPDTIGDDLDEQVVVNNDASLVTVKTLASGDSTPDEGDTVTFQIQVTNSGAAQATNVSLTDLLPSGLTATVNNGSVSQGSYNAATGVWSIGTLNNGANATLTLEGTVDVGQSGSTITNTTTAAAGDQNDPDTVGDDYTESVSVDNDASLVTVKTLASGDSTPDEGDTVTFQIQVTNNGPSQATNVSLNDQLPAGLTATVNNGSVSQGSYNAATGVWSIGTLNNGASATITLEGTVDVGEGGNTIDNVTTAAAGDQFDPDTIGDDLDEQVVVNNDASLVTVKTLASGDSTPDEGDTVTFQIQVTNSGAAQASNVSLTDQLPSGLTATGNNGTASQGSYNAATGVWSVGTLNNGASATLTLEGTVDVGEGGNTITNTTTAAAGDQNDPDTIGDDLDEQVVVNNAASLVTVKTLASGDSTPDEGDTVTFQIQVTNSGAAQATNVSLTDQLPAELTATGNNGTVSQGSYNAATGVWSVGTLNNGASATLTLEGTVNVGQGGNTITNTTTAAAGDQNDPDTIGDDLDEQVVVNNDASLVTVKTLASGDSTPDEGDTVTFQIQVTNSGAAQATNVSLNDQLPAGLTATVNNGTTSQGSYNAATGIWSVGTLNNGASATLTLEGTVDVGEGGSTITNTTTAAAGDQNDPDTIGDDLEEQVVVNNDASLVTVKTLASGDSTPDEGDTVTFQIQVTNNGAAQATNVSLTDVLPSGLTATANNGTTSQGSYNAATGIWLIGTLNNGASGTLTLEGTVDVGQANNTITNTTTAAAGDQNDPDTIGDDYTESVSVVNDSALVTVKTLASGDSTPDEGDTVTFQILVTNNGAAQATNVSLTDQLPVGLTATANNGTVSQGSYNAATGVWSIGTLNNGASATITLEGTVDVGEGGNTITNVTTAAAGDQNDPDTIGDDLDEQVVVNNDASLVTVKTLASGDSTPTEGDVVTFQIQVTNSGAAQATNVSLTDQLPSGLTATVNNGTSSQGSYNAATGTWSVGTLNNGESATLTLEGTVDVGEGGNTITNVTTAAAGDQNDPDTIGDDLDEQVVLDNDASLVTVKTLASGDSTPAEGDVVTFQIQVTNSGAAQATNVSLTDQLPAGLTATGNNGTASQGSYNAATGVWSIGTLNDGATATITLEGTVDAGEGGNTITNTTTAAAGDQNDPDTVGDDYTESVVVDNDASLVTVKTLVSGNSTPDEGDTVTFQIQVTNNGAAQATNVSLTDQLPAELTATANNGTVSQGSYNAATGVWSIGTLNDGAVATITLEGVVNVGQGGNTITNITTAAAGDQNDPDTIGDDLDEQVVVNNDAALVTVKTLASSDSTPDEGDTVTFQIQVTNSGAAQATNVSLTDQLPTGLTVTANNGTTSQGSYNAATGVWSIGTLNNGASATLTLEGTVDVGEGGNSITNTTTAAAGDQNDPDTIGDDLDEQVVVNNDASLVTVKTLASGDSTPDEGDTVTFQIQVTNSGAAQATNVSLTDQLPGGLTATANNGTVSQGTYNAATGVWSIGTLNNGASATLTLEGTVDTGQSGNTITNTTTAAAGDQNDPDTVGDDYTESVSIDNEAALVTVKTLASGDATPNEGDTVTFQIQVTNNGAAQATNVTLSDQLPAGLTATANNGTVSQGSYNAATGVWSIGTLNNGATATITLEGTVDVGQGGNTITNTTTEAVGDQFDPDTIGDDYEEQVVVNNDAALVTVKTLASGDATPDEGDTVTFQIQVTNNGAAQATNVLLTDQLPAGLTATANNGTVSQGSYNAATGVWSIGTLNNSATATITLEGTVNAGQGDNTITNVTTAAVGDQNDPDTIGDDYEEQVIVNNDASLVTVKTLASGDATPDEGDTVTFQIQVTNSGAAQATNVSLTDLLPGSLTATANNGTASQGSYNAATGVWSIGTLNNGASATLTLEGTVDAGEGGTTITNTTTAAAGDQNDPDTIGDDYEEQVVVNNDASLVTVKTLASGDSTPDEGDTVTFQIQVTNNGAAQATNVSLTDLLPGELTATANNGTASQGSYNATTGVWSIGTLNNGASATLTLEGTVDVGEGGTTITNITTAAAGDQNDLDTIGDDYEEQVTVNNATALVTVKTLASGDATPQEGDTVTFQIQVTNNGAAQATNVLLSDTLPPGLSATAANGTVTHGFYNSSTGTWSIGTLNNGEVATLTLEGTVNLGQAGNTITNITTAAVGDQPDPDTVGDDYIETVSVSNDASLVTVKTLASGDSTPDEGDTVTFQIQVTNNGAAQATNVSLADLLPSGLTATANNGTASQGSYNSATGVWDIGTLNNGANATLTLEGTVNVGQAGNTITNITTAAAGDQNDPDTIGDDYEEQVVVSNDASLVTVKTLISGDSAPDEGDTVTFQIEVTNNGAAQATNVSLTDLLPGGLTATANNGSSSQGSYNAATGIWTIGTLNNGANATLVLEGTVDVGQGGNTITNITTAAAGDQNDPDTIGDDYEEQVVVNNDASLVTVKTLLSGDSRVEEGDTVTFQIEVSNNGAAQATNVSLTDQLPTELTATGNNGTVSQGTYTAATGVWSIGTLDLGASATLVLEGTVNAGQGGNTITNVTTAAAGDQNDPDTIGDDLVESVDAVFARIELEKSAGLIVPASSGMPGNFDVTYNFEVTNTGSVDLINLALTDDWLSNFGTNIVRILPGSVSVTNINAATAPGANVGYVGNATENMLDGTGLVEPGQRFNVSVVVELDPDADPSFLVSGALLNQGTAFGEDAADPGTPVSDASDDPNDTTDFDPDADGDPDDFTAVSFSDISVTKVLGGAPVSATSGTAGNIDVTFNFVVTNTGSNTLSNLSLLDDFATEFGGAFVRVVPGTLAITNIDASNPPVVNGGFDGAVTTDMLSGAVTDQLDSQQSFQVSVVVELDPDDPSANLVGGVLQNQASASATDPNSNTITDQSDDTADPTDSDPDGDNNPDDPTGVTFANIDLQKEVGLVTPATSGTEGNYDVAYSFVVTNTGLTDLNNLSLVDDWDTQLGQNFIRIVPGSVSVTNVDAAVAPGANTGYAGGPTENMLDGTGFLSTGQSFRVDLVVEVDPDADPLALVNGQLENQGSVSGTDPAAPGSPVSDTSDDPSNATNSDPDGDNDPDDPTLVGVRGIDLQKTATQVVPSSSGVAGNVDVRYTFVVENTGSLDLLNLTLVDDWASQFGGAFVGVLPGSVTVTNIDATTVPGANAAYAGGPTENMLDGTGLLASSQQFEVSVLVEVDPDNLLATYQPGGVLENQAVAGGEDLAGNTVTDVSDDPADSTDTDPDGDNNPDDPTPLTVSNIELEKEAVGLVPASSGVDGNFDVTYTFTVTNTGTTSLDNLTLTDDWASQLGGNFVGIVPGSVTTSNIDATVLPGSNGTYTGGTTENMLDGTGTINPGQSFTVTVIVEVDPDADPPSLIGGQLVTQGTATGEDPTGGTVSDESDDPNDAINTDPDTDNDPDDPTVVGIADISLAKVISGPAVPASSGTPDNIDVSYALTVTNTGSETISNLSLVDDLATQMGGAFIRVIPGTVAVTNIDATSAPVANGAYDGLAGSDMLLGSPTDQLQVGQSFRVDVTIELDPDNPAATLVNGRLENQATVFGDAPSGVVSDLSDDPSDPANTDPDADNNPDDPTPLTFANIALEKSVNSIVNASSGIEGNFDTAYQFTVTNTGLTDLNNVSLVDDWAAQLGGNFVRIVPGSISVTNIDAAVVPGSNASYAGGATENMLDGAGLLLTGQSFNVVLVVEVDPDADPSVLVNGALENEATVTGEEVGSPGNFVSDLSDDPADSTNRDPDGDNDPDDPTAAVFSSISIDKSTVTAVPAASGTNGNFDVTYRFVVSNDGSAPLTNLSITDDWASQFGANFVSVLPGSVSVANIDATTLPGANGAYIGTAADNMLDGTGVIESGQRFEVSVVVEVDADADPSLFVNGELLNQAVVSGQDPSGGTVTDISDDPADLTDNDLNGDNNPDDPTPVSFSGIVAEKTTGSVMNATSGTAGNYDVIYNFTVRNAGSETLTNLTLVDDWGTLFGANFVRVVPGSVSVTNVDAATPPTANPTYAGGATESMVGGGSLDSGQSYQVQVAVELDPDADPSLLVNGALINFATVTGDTPTGNTVTDITDDPTDATGTIDDPTPLIIPDIQLTKAITGIVAQPAGTVIADYLFVATNVGNDTLTNLSLVDDWASQFGGAFVNAVAGSVSVTNIDATVAPGANATYAGGATENMLDGTGTIASGQSFEVRLQVVIDPASPTANLVNGGLENIATVSGQASDGSTITDLSDDPTNTTDIEIDGDNEPDDPTAFTFSGIVAQKTTGSFTNASSGAAGNYDVTYNFTVTNAGFETLNNLTLIDDWAGLFGANFVRVVPGSVSVTNVDAITAPTASATYAGGAAESMIGGGVLESGQSYQTSVVVELDPDADPSLLVNGALFNFATAGGDDPTGNTVTDITDDPNDTTGTIDDPTPLLIPDIQLTKAITGVAPQPSGNVIADYEFVATNVGNDTLTNLFLVDDWASQFGGAFVSIIPGSVSVTNIDATLAPGANATYVGGANENILDGTGTLESGQSFTVGVQVEIDPDSPTANLVNGGLENIAIIAGQDSTGSPVTDLSDDPTDPTDLEDDGDNEPDDPTRFSFAGIVAQKTTGTFANAASGIAGNYDVVYNFTVSNAGVDTLTNLTLVDDWAGLFGANFVRVVPGSVSVSNIDATLAPTASLTYAGGAAESMIGGGVLESGQSYQVSVVVELDPDADPSLLVNGALINSATAGGDDPSGNTVTDITDDPTDLTGTVDDPTPLIISDIELTKAVTNLSVQPSGNAIVDYTFVATNTGNDTLTNLSLVDDWSTQYGGAFINIVPGSVFVTNIDAVIAPGANATYAGGATENMLDGTGTIDSGQSFEVRLQAVLDPLSPTANLVNGGLENVAIVSGQGTNGIVTDLSDDPTNAADIDDDGDNDPDDPTTFSFSDVSVAKQVIAAVPNGDNWDIELELEIQNTGGTDLTDIGLIEDLATQFGNVFVSVAAQPIVTASSAAVTPTLNAQWNGTSETNVFDGVSGLLQPGEQVTVRFTVTIDPDISGEAQPLTNQVQVEAVDPNSDLITDTSDDGDDPTTSNPGSPGDGGSTDDPTPILIGDIGLAKQVVDINTDFATQSVTLTVRLVVENIGTVDLNNLALDDDVATQYGANFVAVSRAPVIVATSGGAIAPNLNPAWATDTALNMFDGTSGLLPPSGQLVIEFGVELQPTATGIEVTNQAFAAGDDPNGVSVTDISDDGLSPHFPNGSGSTDDPTVTNIIFFTFDTFNNFANAHGRGPIFVHIAPPRPTLDTLYTGIAEPGTTLRFDINDQTGLGIGTRTVVADTAGNWLAHFPNATLHARDQHFSATHFGASFDGIGTAGLSEFGSRGHHIFHSRHFGQLFNARTFTASTLGHHLYHMPGTEIDGQPHRMQVQQTPAVQNAPLGGGDSGWNVRRYFHPAVHPQLYFYQNSSISSVFAEQPRNVLSSLHDVQSRPLQLGTNPHANELNVSSTNVSW